MSIHEKRINQWRTSILASQKLQAEVVDELEDHLRAELDDLSKLDIVEDETFMLAQCRMGDLGTIENEFSKLHRHKRWLRQIMIMLGGYILLTLLFQLVQVIALAVGIAPIFTRISPILSAQIYAMSSMVLLALFTYGLWCFAQRRSPMQLLGYQSIQDGSPRKLVQNTVAITLIVFVARTLDMVVSQKLFHAQHELHTIFQAGDPEPSVMETIRSFAYMKSVHDGTTFFLMLALSIVVLMVLIRQKTHQATAASS